MLVETGTQWLGKIPEHWELSKIGHCFKHRNQTVSDKEFQPLSVTKNGVLPQLETAAKSDNSDGRKLIRKGDFVINQRSDRKGSGGVSPFDGSCSVIYTVLEPLKYEPRYAHHLFRSVAFQEEFYRWGTGIVDDLWSTRYSLMRQIVCPVPPIEEQKAIADFLDRELRNIDVLIGKKESLIATLFERRISLVSTATLNGIRKCVSAHKSIDWLPPLPSHWRVAPLWSMFRRVKKTGRPDLELLALYREHGVLPKASRDDNHNVESEDLSSYQLVKKGDLVVNKMKAWQGSISLSALEGIISPAYFVYRPHHEQNSRYFHYLLRSAPYIAEYNKISKGVRIGQWDLEPQLFRSIPVLVPTHEEQDEIVAYLDSQLKKNTYLMDRCKESVELLKERREALVSAAVTGNIDIRGKN